jgi:Methyltransferase domain
VASAINISRPDSVQDKIFAAQHRRFLGEIGDVLSRSSFWVPEYICPSTPAWIEHAPFAFWICDALRPRRFVELGTHYGYSYFAFCQAIDRLALGTVAYAVDTWQGDEHAGFYDEHVFQSVAVRNNQRYSAFSCLMRSTFEDALEYFEDGSVDLLHIDGRHFYDDVKHDFTIWRRKLTEDAVVLLHDTNVRERRFGVWKFFKEMAERHPSFQFYHGHGLGVLAPGEHIPEPLAPLLQASSEPADQIRGVYAALGGALTRHAGVEDLRADIEQRAATEAVLRADIEERAATEAALRADIEQRSASEAALRADIEQHAATEGALRAEVEHHAATAAALRAEVKQHAMSEAALRVDIEQRAATAAALRAEVNSLRIKFEEAERGRLDGEAAASARQAEITSLRGELTAARKVGTAVLASLRSAPIPVSLPPRDARLLTVMLRRFGLPANYLLPSAG